MLTVKTLAALDKLNYPRLYTLETIRRYTRVWVYTFAEIYPPNMSFDSKLEQFIFNHGWWDVTKHSPVVCKDDAIYIRCAEKKEDANLSCIKDGEMVANRVIKVGEELLEWYPDYMIPQDLKKYQIDQAETQRVLYLPQEKGYFLPR